MSSQELPAALQLKPIISYPREAQVGKTYLVSIDVQLATPNASWDFPEEEYTIGFILNTSPYFTCEPLHDVWPTIILHRYGGTYGPAEFLLTAADHEIERGQISITLVNGWGIPMTRLELPCEVGLESGTQAKQEIEITSRERVTSNTDETLHEEVDKSTSDLQRAIPSVKLESEQATRVFIEEQLVQAGWIVQSTADIDIKTSQGIIIREFPLTTGIVDYLLVIDGEAAGIIEVKGRSHTLAGAREQIKHYQTGIPEKEAQIRFTRPILPFGYETNGYHVIFTNELEPEARSREIFHFHQPQTLAWWLKQAPIGTPNDLNNLQRSRLRRMSPLLRVGLRECQFEAISNLERSLAANRSRALIHMASGTGKTYMAVSEIYRLLRCGCANRILFLVDRNNLGQQAFSEFQQFVAPDLGQRFTELYNVQLLSSNQLDSGAQVCITTIQRLYSILQGDNKLERSEEDTLFTSEENENEPIAEVQYHPNVPIEYFDMIFIDECHRSIYGKWRPVIEYFDAFLIGMTAFPTSRAFSFFQKNLVMGYSREQALADGIIVDYDIYRIRTEITEQGSRIEQGIVLPKRNKQTRQSRYESLRDDLIYEGSQISQDIVVEDQLRTVLTAFRDNLPVLFPGRTVVPKTVIFARDNSHAEDVVNMVREVFGKDNNFVKKITYSIVKGRPEELIHEFRNAYNPRIVVTVNMLLGVDILPLECIILMRPIRSAALYEQILGLGSRTIQNTSLRAVTPDARNKAHFILVDTVGATYNLQSENSPMERKPSLSLEKLMQQAADGIYEEDSLRTLAGRLGEMTQRMSGEENKRLLDLCNKDIHALALGLVDVVNIDKLAELAQQLSESDAIPPDPQYLEEATLQLSQQACEPFKNSQVRDLLRGVKAREEQIIDDVSIDRVIMAQFDNTRALQIIAIFYAFMEEYKNTINAFKSAYNSRSLNQLVQSTALLVKDFQANDTSLTIDSVWHAYQILYSSQVRVRTEEKQLLPDMMALVCYTLQRNTDANATLEPFQDTVNRRFAEWLNEQQKERKTAFNEQQIRWLERIRDHIANSLQFAMDDFDSTPFSFDGGSVAAHFLFRNELESIVQELNAILVFGKPETQHPL